jgi:hypothetical protein
MKELVFLRYTYWDGFRVIKTMIVNKKTKVVEFLEKATKNMIEEYFFLKTMHPEDMLMVVKNEPIKSNLSFYEVIERNLKTPTGDLLFNFKKKIIKDENGKDVQAEVDDNALVMIIEKHKFERHKFIYTGIPNPISDSK